MGKFLGVQEKLSELVKERKHDLKFKALGMTSETLDVIYRIYFYAIDAFIRGNPRFWERQAFKIYVIGGIDTKYNSEAKKRCKKIISSWKQGLSLEDQEFLEKELRPYFANSLLKQHKKTEDMLTPLSNDEINRRIKKRNKELKGDFR